MTRHFEEDTRALLQHYARTQAPEVRDELIRRHERLVRSLAHKFERPGIPAEDLLQTGLLALVRALDRYDPCRGADFTTYVVPCITGEIKRYFRDQTWALKIPRRLGELAQMLRRTEEGLTNRLGRVPTIAEMADALEVTVETVAEAMEVYRAYEPRSLDQPRMGEDGLSIGTLAETLGERDAAVEIVAERAALDAAISTLEWRDQVVIRRRFFDDCTQSQVASELNVSQMHVSRLERSAIGKLRELIDDRAAL